LQPIHRHYFSDPHQTLTIKKQTVLLKQGGLHNQFIAGAV
jgi:hypothetical protein